MEKNKIKIFSLILFTAVFVCCFSFFSNALAVPDTTLYFNPSTDSFNVGDDFNLDAMIDPGENSVSAVTLHFTFDYTKLRLDSITESAAFSDVLSAASINNTNGTASIDLGVGTSNPSVSEISTMATLNFHALSAGNNSLVEYTSASMAAAEGESGDVVTERQGATLTIVEADTTAPTITSISSNKANGTYTIGEVIDIDVTFSEAVTSTGNVTVTLETGDTDRTCTFTMSNAITGTCNYTVQAGDTTSDLNATISGTINDQSSNPMTNFTPTTGLAANKAIVIDTTVPVLTETTPVSTPTIDTTPNYVFNSTEAGTITYGGSCSSATTVASIGANTITFSTLASGTYSNCTILVTDTAGNESNTLSITSFQVDVNGPTFTINEGTDVGPTQSDTINITVSDSNSITVREYGFSSDSTCNGSDAYGNSFTSAVNFSITGDYTNYLCVMATDSLSNTSYQLVGQLNTDNTAPVVELTAPVDSTTVNENTLIIFSDDEETDPECSPDNTNWTNCVSNSTSLGNLTGWSSISDGATFTLYLRDTDSAGNTGTDSVASLTKEADTTAPTITSISSNKANGTYTIGEVIDIDVTFSEAVTSTGNVTVTLETGDTDRTCTFTMSNAITGTCNYTVQAGDTTSDLNATISGTINDQSSNPMTNFTPTTGLAANKAIVIDTTVIPPVEEEDDDSEEEDDHDSLDLDDVEYTSTANTITIKWETNNKADSKVKYGKFKNALTKEKENKEEEKKHKITLKDLEPGTEYFFKIYSEDEYGDKETSDFYSIATTKNNLLVPSNPIADVGNEVVRKEETQQQGEKQEEKQGKNQEENKNFIQEVKFKIVDDKGVPIADLFVTIYSEPQSAYTDKSGVVTFKNIALGKHTIKFVYNDKNYAEVVELTEFNTKKGAIALPSVESKPEIKIFENESKFSWKIIFYIVAVALTLVFTVWFLRKKFEK